MSILPSPFPASRLSPAAHIFLPSATVILRNHRPRKPPKAASQSPDLSGCVWVGSGSRAISEDPLPQRGGGARPEDWAGPTGLTIAIAFILVPWIYRSHE